MGIDFFSTIWYGIISKKERGNPMPSHYTHYRFGAAVLTTLPADIRRSIQRFRRLYDVGLHGPDLFFYHRLGTNRGTGSLGLKFHEQTGKTFFPRICRSIRLDPSEAASACLYGVLCHYVLDSTLHPFIVEQAKALGVTHVEIETEFDRFLMERDDKLPPDSTRLTNHLKLTDGECETVAKFYPPATGKTVKSALRATVVSIKLLYAPEGVPRKLVETGLHVAGKELGGMLMTPGPNPKCAHLNEQILALYQQAMDSFPEYLRQLQANMTYSAPLEEEFSAPFA